MGTEMGQQLKVALGVTGCIAAYKAVEVLRGLQKRDVAVQVVMTEHATRFVAPLTFQAISGTPVIGQMFVETDDPEIKHIAIAGSIDLLLVAPATANTLAKFANGLADDFLSTLYISTTAPVLVAPAMNVEMWLHPATRANVARLKERGVRFVDPGEGYLACKSVGPGRLAEPSEIVDAALELIERKPSAVSLPSDLSLSGERILITAGPTYEPIDPVRGITNRSSGRMGLALAEAALDRGADVTLVLGPVSHTPPSKARTIQVRSSAEMYDSVVQELEGASIVIMAAAVADYRPAQVADQKIKKDSQDGLVIELERTEDILEEVCRRKGDRIVVGFAAETQDLIANARKKLVKKNADLIVANDVSSPDAGFDVQTNRISLVSATDCQSLPLMTKREAADRILDSVMQVRRAARSSR
jgi:phosphopantothenoylcysteine decarboxylase/phosphopantothenate--cysteine ligase